MAFAGRRYFVAVARSGSKNWLPAWMGID